MSSLLAISSSLVYLILADSVVALLLALICWGLLRWNTRCPVPFNRVYLACLLWALAASAVTLGLISLGGKQAVGPGHQLLASGWIRVAVLLDMLLGVALLWRLVPRGDGHRITLGNACLCVGVIAVLALIPLAGFSR
ncbi:hypothetical protein [Oleiagrimonas soli]|uniref:Uncharacterized protein n=1 Tax=Oleiagrimonas soli TaxID=1543381 RepID=A0A099CV75_9GAMM|nr:hypothetical protein [Oleiagrimonas soli]KGI76925.1 hypothetical protein LF63_0113480 [Oleiagrimonas soli]MBB6185210.1 hypothetical protein [Oleiagrimonas soli]